MTDGHNYVCPLRIRKVFVFTFSVGRLAALSRGSVAPRLPFSELWKGHQERTWTHSDAAHRLFMKSEQGIQSRLSSAGLMENNIFLSGIVYLPTSSYLTALML